MGGNYYFFFINFGTKKITLLYRDFVISVFFITRVHCIFHLLTMVPGISRASIYGSLENAYYTKLKPYLMSFDNYPKAASL